MIKKYTLVAALLILGLPARADIKEDQNTLNIYLANLAIKNGYIPVGGGAAKAFHKVYAGKVAIPSAQQAVQASKNIAVYVKSNPKPTEITHIPTPTPEEQSWMVDPPFTMLLDNLDPCLGISLPPTDVTPIETPSGMYEIPTSELEVGDPWLDPFPVTEESFEPVAMIRAIPAVKPLTSIFPSLDKEEFESDYGLLTVSSRGAVVIDQNWESVKIKAMTEDVEISSPSGTIKLHPGQEAIFTKRPNHIKDGVARRNVKDHGFVMTSEFSIPTVLKKHKEFKSHKDYNKMLKTAAALMYVTKNHGKYRY